MGNLFLKIENSLLKEQIYFTNQALFLGTGPATLTRLSLTHCHRPLPWALSSMGVENGT